MVAELISCDGDLTACKTEHSYLAFTKRFAELCFITSSHFIPVTTQYLPPSYHMGETRHREAKLLIRGHTAELGLTLWPQFGPEAML